MTHSPAMKRIRILAGLACALALGPGGRSDAGTARETRESPSYERDRGGPAPHLRTSEHFALRWGDANKTDVTIDEAYQERAMKWLEQLWSLYIDQLKFPAGRHSYRINAYITGTGLKPFLDGYAYGFPDPEGYGVLIGHPSIYNFGHNGSAHEFAHALQGETRGFRDSEYVGWFWECHAQFMAHQAGGTSDLPHVLDRYAQSCHWDLASTRHHYGSWIFLQYLIERYTNGMDLVNRIWVEPRQNPDEDAIAKLRRMLPLEGDREQAWADLVGDFARRNVAWNSYKLGREYRTSMKFFESMDRRNYFTYMEASPSRDGWWRVPRIYWPQQNGYNVIPLVPEPGAKEAEVTLSGFAEPSLGSGWRATLVAVDAENRERFSPTWTEGEGRLDLRAGERLYLVVAATPRKHSPPRFVVNYPDTPVHPYETRCRGALPWNLDSRIRPLPRGIAGHAHANGGGFVADTATVAPTAFVGKGAAVLDGARVEGNARIEDFATVSGRARVSCAAVVAGNALVTQDSAVGGNALVTDFAELCDRAAVRDNARVLAAGRVFGGNEVCDDATVKGLASIRGVRKVGGCAVADGEIEWDFNAKELMTDVCFGTLLQPEPNRQRESHHLYALYAMGGGSAWRLRDAFGTCDGVLQGGAKLVSDPDRGPVLQLTGHGQYADLPRELALFPSMTMTADIRLDGAEPGQCLFSFGRDARHYVEFLATDTAGRIGVRWFDGSTGFDLQGPQPPVGRWFRLTLAVGEQALTLSLDGEKIISWVEPASPVKLRSSRCYLGRDLEGRRFLRGRLSGVAMFSRSVEIADAEAALKERSPARKP